MVRFPHPATGFVRAKPIQGKHPLTGEPITIRPRPDGASVILDGKVVAHVGWTQSGTDEVILSGDRATVVSLGREIATALDADKMDANAISILKSMTDQLPAADPLRDASAKLASATDLKEARAAFNNLWTAVDTNPP